MSAGTAVSHVAGPLGSEPLAPLLVGRHGNVNHISGNVKNWGSTCHDKYVHLSMRTSFGQIRHTNRVAWFTWYAIISLMTRGWKANANCMIACVGNCHSIRYQRINMPKHILITLFAHKWYGVALAACVWYQSKHTCS